MRKKLNSFMNYLFADKYLCQESTEKIQAVLIFWVSTTIIMWSYMVFSYFIYEANSLGNIGLVLATIHTLIPFIIKYTNKIDLVRLITLVSSLIFQITFCLLNERIDTASIIFFMAHPVLVSLFGNKQLIFLSIILNAIGVYVLIFIEGLKLNENITVSSFVIYNIVILFFIIVLIKIFEQRTKAEKDKTQVSEDRYFYIQELMKIVSHDINNSLTISHLTCNLISKELNSSSNVSLDFIKEKVEYIKKSTNQIEEVSKSILKWSKASDTKIQLEIKPLEIKQVINHITDSFNIIMENKKISFKFDYEQTKDCSIMVDSEAFRNQILNNIISNAIKYSNEGSDIKIRSFIKGTLLSLSITDSGDGIDQDLIKNIFDPSKSISTPGTKNEFGSGFGMPIAKKLIELMGGTIDISSVHKSSIPQNSEVLSGTTITLSVPLC